MNADLKTYFCGLRPGDRVRLKKDLIITDQNDRPTGEVRKAGEVWTVIDDGCEAKHDLWLQQPDGSPHTWCDDQSVWEYFERI